MMEQPSNVLTLQIPIPDLARVTGFAVTVLYFDNEGVSRVTQMFQQPDGGDKTNLVGAAEMLKLSIARTMSE